MSTVLAKPNTPSTSARAPGGVAAHGRIPELKVGDRLTADEFLRRYEAMPEFKKAELFRGVVYMAPPVTTDYHADPDSSIQGIFYCYAAATPGVKSSTNPTIRFDAKNTPQPDVTLRFLPERGGKSTIDEKGYLVGPPELVAEISASSADIDTGIKFEEYERAKVPEYLVWLTKKSTIQLWELADGKYKLIPPDKDGILRSRIFPGLWLDVKSLLAGDAAGVMAVLQKGLSSDAHAAFVKQLSAK